jgi:hypothetical protein
MIPFSSRLTVVVKKPANRSECSGRTIARRRSWIAPCHTPAAALSLGWLARCGGLSCLVAAASGLPRGPLCSEKKPAPARGQMKRLSVLDAGRWSLGVVTLRSCNCATVPDYLATTSCPVRTITSGRCPNPVDQYPPSPRPSGGDWFGTGPGEHLPGPVLFWISSVPTLTLDSWI